MCEYVLQWYKIDNWFLYLVNYEVRVGQGKVIVLSSSNSTMRVKYVYNCYNKINALFSGQMTSTFFLFFFFIIVLFNLMCFDLVSECLSACNAVIFVSQIQKQKKRKKGGKKEENVLKNRTNCTLTWTSQCIQHIMVKYSLSISAVTHKKEDNLSANPDIYLSNFCHILLVLLR